MTFKQDTNQDVNVIQDNPPHGRAHLCLLPRFTSDDPCSSLKSLFLHVWCQHITDTSPPLSQPNTDTRRSLRRTRRICFPSCKVGTKPGKAFWYFIISENDVDEGPTNPAPHTHIWPETQATFTQQSDTPQAVSWYFIDLITTRLSKLTDWWINRLCTSCGLLSSVTPNLWQT